MILVLIIFLILIFFIYYKNSKSGLDNVVHNRFCPVVNNPSFSTTVDILNDITIKPIGCFTNISTLCFTSCVNPYSKESVTDSGINITKYPDDIKTLIKTVIKNGYDIYGNKILDKYKKTDYSNLSLIELGTLGYLIGYRYISISSNGYNNQNNIFFSYSPPMDDKVDEKHIAKSDLPNYTLTPKLDNYSNEMNTKPGKELSCGYPCLQNKTSQTFVDSDGVTKQYMCGSVAFPSIKTPARYSVYQLIEKK